MQHLPIILIELVLVFGGVLAFAWWQLRSVKRDRLKAAQEREAAAAKGAQAAKQPVSAQAGGAELPKAAIKDREKSP